MNCLSKLMEKYGTRIKYHTIEVRIDSATEKHFLPDDTLLLNKNIVGLCWWDLATTSPETGRALVNKAVRNDAYMTFKSNNIVILDNFPYSLITSDDEFRDVWEVYLSGFTPSKSYITISDTSLITVGTSVMMTFLYLD